MLEWAQELEAVSIQSEVLNGVSVRECEAKEGEREVRTLESDFILISQNLHLTLSRD